MSTGGTRDDEHELRRRAKRALRDQMRAVRDALPGSACQARSEKITEHLLTLAELRSATTVLAFASIRNEVRTGPFIDAVRARGQRTALPRVVDDELQLHLVDASTALVDGPFSVPEPPRNAPEVQPDEVEFALIPALAVDLRGYRIGYGGGYYDRLLPRLGGALKCVAAYDFQLIAEVPEQPFDAPVDLVVTDERVVRLE